MTVDLEHFLVVSAILFSLGLLVALSKRNAIAVLMGVELMLNAANLSLVAFSRFAEPAPGQTAITGQVFAVFVLTIAAAEVAVGLALAVSVYRNRSTISVDEINLLRN